MGVGRLRFEFGIVEIRVTDRIILSNDLTLQLRSALRIKTLRSETIIISDRLK